MDSFELRGCGDLVSVSESVLKLEGGRTLYPRASGLCEVQEEEEAYCLDIQELR